MTGTVLFCQMVMLGFQALWLTLGVRDNLLYPLVNERFTTEVMDMSRLRQEYPEAYSDVAHRRIESRKLQLFAFRLVVAWEVLAVLALWVGVGALALAVLGSTQIELARTIALIAALMFTATWAGFLVVGNHFSYWLGHEGAQVTHFHMTLWGMGMLVFLSL